MKAAVWHNIEDVRIDEVQEPVVGQGQIKVKVEWTGICGSDLAVYKNGMMLDEHPLTGQKPPLTLGHEFSGTIAEIGEGVTSHTPGERVVVDPLIYCGKCDSCRRGYYNHCKTFGFVGVNSDGGFAKYVIVDEEMIHILPDNVSFEEGAVVEPAAVGFYAVKESIFKAGDTVAIFGAGPIGLLTLMAAKVAGATKIIVSDLSEERLEKAKELGATTTIEGMRDDIVETIHELTGGGVKVAYECAGAQPTMTNAIASVKQGGQVMAVAMFSKPVSIDMNQLLYKGSQLTSITAYRHVFPEVIELIANGTLDVKPIITKKIDLDNIIDEGFKPLIEDKKQAKILVRPT